MGNDRSRNSAFGNIVDVLTGRNIEIAKYRYWFELSAWVMGAIIILFFAYQAPKDSTLSHLLRDIGIAIVVAVIIAAIYETYARHHFEAQLMSKAINVLIADFSRDDVWEEVKKQLIEKHFIRENLRVEMSLKADEKLLHPGQMVLEMVIQYELCGLRSEPKIVEIEHYLDEHLRIKEAKLPCFEFICIGNDKDCSHEVTEGEFKKKVKVPAKDKGTIEVRTRRKEVIYVPGNHCLTMTGITKGVELKLWSIPNHLNLEVLYRMRPHDEAGSLEVNGMKAARFDEILLLSGQTIEFLFKRRTD